MHLYTIKKIQNIVHDFYYSFITKSLKKKPILRIKKYYLKMVP